MTTTSKPQVDVRMIHKNNNCTNMRPMVIGRLTDNGDNDADNIQDQDNCDNNEVVSTKSEKEEKENIEDLKTSDEYSEPEAKRKKTFTTITSIPKHGKFKEKGSSQSQTESTTLSVLDPKVSLFVPVAAASTTTRVPPLERKTSEENTEMGFKQKILDKKQKRLAALKMVEQQKRDLEEKELTKEESKPSEEYAEPEAKRNKTDATTKEPQTEHATLSVLDPKVASFIPATATSMASLKVVPPQETNDKIKTEDTKSALADTDTDTEEGEIKESEEVATKVLGVKSKGDTPTVANRGSSNVNTFGSATMEIFDQPSVFDRINFGSGSDETSSSMFGGDTNNETDGFGTSSAIIATKPLSGFGVGVGSVSTTTPVSTVFGIGPAFHNIKPPGPQINMVNNFSSHVDVSQSFGGGSSNGNGNGNGIGDQITTKSLFRSTKTFENNKTEPSKKRKGNDITRGDGCRSRNEMETKNSGRHHDGEHMLYGLVPGFVATTTNSNNYNSKNRPRMNMPMMMGYMGGMGDIGSGMVPLPLPPPPPPMMMGMGGGMGGDYRWGRPPGNYGPGGNNKADGGGNNNVGAGRKGGRGRGMSMTLPAWMTQGRRGGGIDEMVMPLPSSPPPPPPPPPPPMMQQQQWQQSSSKMAPITPSLSPMMMGMGGGIGYGYGHYGGQPRNCGSGRNNIVGGGSNDNHNHNETKKKQKQQEKERQREDALKLKKCLGCNKLGRDHFSKSQWKKCQTGQGECKECVETKNKKEVAMKEELRVCVCGKRGQANFSKPQWKKFNTNGKGECKECVEALKTKSVEDAIKLKVCIVCGVGGEEYFSFEKWKGRGEMKCAGCVDLENNEKIKACVVCGVEGKDYFSVRRWRGLSEMKCEGCIDLEKNGNDAMNEEPFAVRWLSVKEDNKREVIGSPHTLSGKRSWVIKDAVPELGLFNTSVNVTDAIKTGDVPAQNDEDKENVATKN